MFAGKTSELLREVRRSIIRGKNVLVINFAADERYGSDNFVYTHDRDRIPCRKTARLSEIPVKDIIAADVIAINEGQFFPDLYDFTTNTVDNLHKRVIITALDGDSNRAEFGDTLRLIPFADKYVKLYAFCAFCDDDVEAPFTIRLNSDKIPKTQILIGADTIYKPCCRYHYNQFSSK
jgi:thymidine kinase